jgi:hypothetical protein
VVYTTEEPGEDFAMAIVQGIREKVHLPIYDSLTVDAEKQLRDAESSSTLKFFVDVQRKTKLETNLQSASLLPHYNTFEARALRVVISDLPPVFPAKVRTKTLTLDVTNEDGTDDILVNDAGEVPITGAGTHTVKAEAEFGLDRLIKLAREASENEDEMAQIDVEDEDVSLIASDLNGTKVNVASVAEAGGCISLDLTEIEDAIFDLDERERPLKEQVHRNNGSGTIIGKFIYNTVTTLYVGEKIMIQMPTWFFPAGAGPYSESGHGTTHGKASPEATFRFAEPIFIDKQQNFRVEIEVPDTDTLKEIQRIYGPLNLWVVLDGYMTRDVQ